MLIKKVILDNIKSHKHSEIDLYPGINAIIGNQGSGKTTIVEAIGVALFQSLDYKQNQFIKKGQKRGEIQVIFESNGKEYKIVKSFGSNSEYYIEYAGDRVVELKEEVEMWLRRELKLDKNQELSSMFQELIGPPQGTHIAPFLLSPAQRKKVFDPILGIEEYPNMWTRLRHVEKFAGEKSSAIELELENAKATIETIGDVREQEKEAIECKRIYTNEVRELKIVSNEANEELVELEEKQTKSDKIELLSLERKTLKDQLDDVKDRISIIQDDKKKLKALEPDIKKYKVLEAQRSELSKQLAIQSTKRGNMRDAGLRLKTLGEDKDELLEDLSDVSDSIRASERYSEVADEILSIEKRMSNISTLISHYSTYDEFIEKGQCPILSKDCPLKDELLLCKSQSEDMNTEYNGLNEDVVKLAEEKYMCSGAKEKVKKIPIIEAKIKSIDDNISEMEKNISEIGKDIKKIDNIRPEYDGIIDAIEELGRPETKAEVLKHNISNLDKLREKRGIIRDRRESCKIEIHKLKDDIKGFKAELIPALRTKCNNLLERLTSKERDVFHETEKINAFKPTIASLEKAEKLYKIKTVEHKRSILIQDNIKITRSIIKEIPPYLVDRYLTNVNYDANKVMREMSRKYDDISWLSDYELTMDNKTFKQLSGGEEMTASICIRLALLKNLSKINLAFFDEPTDGLDIQHREQLGEMISKITGFNQLIVISHDTTFNTVIENAIHIEKGDEGNSIIK